MRYPIGSFENVRLDAQEFMQEFEQRKRRVNDDLDRLAHGEPPEYYPELSIGELMDIQGILNRWI